MTGIKEMILPLFFHPPQAHLHTAFTLDIHTGNPATRLPLSHNINTKDLHKLSNFEKHL